MLKYQTNNPKYPIKSILFMLHGWGMDKNEMVQFFKLFQDSDNYLLVAIEAPYWRENVQGYSWFTMKNRVKEAFVGAAADDIRKHQLIPAMEAEFHRIDKLIQTLCSQYNVTEYSLLGYSQGAMMALHYGLLTAYTPQKIISIAGYGIYEILDKADIAGKNIVLITGGKDKIVKPIYQKELYCYLKQKKADISLHIIENIGHIPLTEELINCAYRQFLY